MPPPMIPAPRTAARFTGRAAFACFFAIFFTAWSPRKTLTSAWAVGVFAIFAKAAASIGERLVAALARALLHRLDGGHRGGVVRAGLAGDEGLRVRGRPSRPRSRSASAGPSSPRGAPSSRACPSAASLSMPRAASRRSAGATTASTAPTFSASAADHCSPPAIHSMALSAPAEAGEPHGAAPAGEDAELRLREADLRLRGHHAVARGEAQLEAAAEGDAVDGDHRRRVEVLDRGEDGVRVEEPARRAPPRSSGSGRGTR